uniref:Uncharacterized protein n=1 Tax=Setaria italica TaxID=4555 RepID=K4AI78_SETIT
MFESSKLSLPLGFILVLAWMFKTPSLQFVSALSFGRDAFVEHREHVFAC